MSSLKFYMLSLLTSYWTIAVSDAAHLHVPTTFPLTNSTVDQGHLGSVKLGLAAAFFFSVVIACGLPIVLIKCLKRKSEELVSDETSLDAGTRSTSLATEFHYASNFTTPNHSTVNDPQLNNGPHWDQHFPSTTKGTSDSQPLVSPNMAETTDLLTGRQIPNAWAPVRRERGLLASRKCAGRIGTCSANGVAGVAQTRAIQVVNRRKHLRLWLSRLNCCAAGIFLSSGFMELYVDVHEAIDQAKEHLNITSHFPFAPFVSLMGFFLVLSIEQIIWTVRSARLRLLGRRRRFSTPESTCATPLSPPSSASVAGPQTPSRPAQFSFNHTDHTSASNFHPAHAHLSHGHSHLPPVEQMDSFESILRVIVLLCAMSVHALFEGLAVGLQPTVAQTVALFSAVLLHKLIIAVGIGMNLATVTMHPTTSDDDDDNKSIERLNDSAEVTTFHHDRRVGFYQGLSTFILAVASPLGVLIGWALMQQHPSGILLMTTAVLQGIACGTFFYVVFCELLPEEFRGAVGDRMGKLAFLILGFFAVCLYCLLMPH